MSEPMTDERLREIENDNPYLIEELTGEIHRLHEDLVDAETACVLQANLNRALREENEWFKKRNKWLNKEQDLLLELYGEK